MKAIEVNHLSKSYPGKTRRLRMHALTDLSFSCRRGWVHGMIGPNGSGKTTCLRILSGILGPTAGTVRIGDVNLADSRERFRRKVGFVSLTSEPYNRLTAEEFIRYCGRLAQVNDLREKMESLMDRLEVRSFKDRHCGELSTGMKRRVCLAGALVRDPELLIFDEPTSGLDVIGRREILEMFAQMRSMGKTVLFSAHVPEDLEKHCDHLFILNRGRLIAEGTVADVVGKADADSLENAVISLSKHARG